RLCAGADERALERGHTIVELPLPEPVEEDEAEEDEPDGGVGLDEEPLPALHLLAALDRAEGGGAIFGGSGGGRRRRGCLHGSLLPEAELEGILLELGDARGGDLHADAGPEDRQGDERERDEAHGERELHVRVL